MLIFRRVYSCTIFIPVGLSDDSDDVEFRTRARTASGDVVGVNVLGSTREVVAAKRSRSVAQC